MRLALLSGSEKGTTRSSARIKSQVEKYEGVVGMLRALRAVIRAGVKSIVGTEPPETARTNRELLLWAVTAASATIGIKRDGALVFVDATRRRMAGGGGSEGSMLLIGLISHAAQK